MVFTETYNEDRQLCCGRLGSEKILMKEHKDSICCGDVQYNPQTQRCCGDPPEINELSVSCETDCKQVLTQEPTGLHPSHYCMHTSVNKLQKRLPRKIVSKITYVHSKQHDVGTRDILQVLWTV